MERRRRLRRQCGCRAGGPAGGGWTVTGSGRPTESRRALDALGRDVVICHANRVEFPAASSRARRARSAASWLRTTCRRPRGECCSCSALPSVSTTNTRRRCSTPVDPVQPSRSTGRVGWPTRLAGPGAARVSRSATEVSHAPAIAAATKSRMLAPWGAGHALSVSAARPVTVL